MFNWASLTVQILTLVVLIGSVVVIMRQLRQQEQRHQTDQRIAWKTSALELNKLAMAYPEIFRKVLYPRTKDAEEVQKFTSAYSSLHALEIMYYMRKNEGDRLGEKQESDRLDIFLREYVSSHELREAWKVDAAQMAFTKEFQERLNAIIDKHPLKDGEGVDEAKEESGRANLIKLTMVEEGKDEKDEKEIWINANQIVDMRPAPAPTTLIILAAPIPNHDSEARQVRVKESPEIIKGKIQGQNS